MISNMIRDKPEINQEFYFMNVGLEQQRIQICSWGNDLHAKFPE